MQLPSINDLYLCDTAVHKQFDSGDVATIVGREKDYGLGDLIRLTKLLPRGTMVEITQLRTVEQ